MRRALERIEHSSSATARKWEHHGQIQRRHELYRFDFNSGDYNCELARFEKHKSVRFIDKKGWGHNGLSPFFGPAWCNSSFAFFTPARK
jgi:hypothetical protein